MSPVRRKSQRGGARPARGNGVPRVLVIDNYDSFTYNLVQRIGELGAEVEVVRNDAVGAAEVIDRRPERVVLSPGPCTPDEAGISLEQSLRVSERDVERAGGLCCLTQGLSPSCAGRPQYATSRRDSFGLRAACRPAQWRKARDHPHPADEAQYADDRGEHERRGEVMGLLDQQAGECRCDHAGEIAAGILDSHPARGSRGTGEDLRHGERARR